MSERILKALMQLFAIIAKVNINDETNEITAESGSRNVVSLFLKQELNQERVKEYLTLFDSFIDTHHGKSKRKDGKRKRTSVNSVKILRICTQINEELKQRQKLIVLIRIIEFIDSDNEINSQEHEFAATVAETFNISNEEFSLCLNYVTASEDTVLSSPNLLVIDNNKTNKDKETKHIYSETIKGFLRVIQVQSVNTYFVRYYGNHEMYLNGQLFPANRIQILTQEINPDTFDHKGLPSDTHVVMYVVNGKTLYDAVRAYTKVDIFDCYHDKVKTVKGSVIDIRSGYGNIRPNMYGKIKTNDEG